MQRCHHHIDAHLQHLATLVGLVQALRFLRRGCRAEPVRRPAALVHVRMPSLSCAARGCGVFWLDGQQIVSRLPADRCHTGQPNTSRRLVANGCPCVVPGRTALSRRQRHPRTTPSMSRAGTSYRFVPATGPHRRRRPHIDRSGGARHARRSDPRAPANTAGGLVADRLRWLADSRSGDRHRGDPSTRRRRERGRGASARVGDRGAAEPGRWPGPGRPAKFATAITTRLLIIDGLTPSDEDSGISGRRPGGDRGCLAMPLALSRLTSNSGDGCGPTDVLAASRLGPPRLFGKRRCPAGKGTHTGRITRQHVTRRSWVRTQCDA